MLRAVLNVGWPLTCSTLLGLEWGWQLLTSAPISQLCLSRPIASIIGLLVPTPTPPPTPPPPPPPNTSPAGTVLLERWTIQFGAFGTASGRGGVGTSGSSSSSSSGSGSGGTPSGGGGGRTYMDEASVYKRLVGGGGVDVCSQPPALGAFATGRMHVWRPSLHLRALM